MTYVRLMPCTWAATWVFVNLSSAFNIRWTFLAPLNRFLVTSFLNGQSLASLKYIILSLKEEINDYFVGRLPYQVLQHDPNPLPSILGHVIDDRCRNLIKNTREGDLRVKAEFGRTNL